MCVCAHTHIAPLRNSWAPPGIAGIANRRARAAAHVLVRRRRHNSHVPRRLKRHSPHLVRACNRRDGVSRAIGGMRHLPDIVRSQTGL